MGSATDGPRLIGKQTKHKAQLSLLAAVEQIFLTEVEGRRVTKGIFPARKGNCQVLKLSGLLGTSFAVVTKLQTWKPQKSPTGSTPQSPLLL